MDGVCGALDDVNGSVVGVNAQICRGAGEGPGFGPTAAIGGEQGGRDAEQACGQENRGQFSHFCAPYNCFRASVRQRPQNFANSAKLYATQEHRLRPVLLIRCLRSVPTENFGTGPELQKYALGPPMTA